MTSRFDIAERETLALLGPNGAGKTSTIMAIMGHTTIHGGRILFRGEDITHVPPVNRVELGIALVPEGRLLFSDLSVEDNLTVGGYRHSMTRDHVNRERVYALFPRLPIAAPRSQAPCRAASSRCWRWAAR